MMAHKKYVNIGCFQDLRKCTQGVYSLTAVYGPNVDVPLDRVYILCESVIILDRVLPA